MDSFPLFVGLFCNCVSCFCEGNNGSAVAIARSLTRLSRSVPHLQPKIGGKMLRKFSSVY